MPCTYIFFSCACVVFHIVMEQQWGEGGGGGGGQGAGCSHLGQTSNPPRSSESWKGCHVLNASGDSVVCSKSDKLL